MKTFLITGGSGFVGKHAREEIEKNGDKAVVYTGDVRKALQVKEDIDVVVHLAAAFSQKEGTREKDVYETNILGTLNALECCREKKATFVFASTCGVYGNPVRNPVKETHARAPFNPYTQSKVVAEDLCRYYAQDHKFPCVVLRLFNPYGPGQSTDFLIPMIIDAMKMGKELKLHTPGLRRDYVYVNDVARAIVKASERMNGFEVFNVGSGKSRSVQEVIDAVEKCSGKKVKRSFDTGKNVLIKDIYADLAQTKEGLTWIPKVTLEEGIRTILSETG